MIYKAIGLMSGSSLDGLDIAYVHLQETAGKWTYAFIHTDCLPYSNEWLERLGNAVNLSAADYQQLHADYGHYTGAAINNFIEQHGLHHQVHLVASHGHTTFHVPGKKMTAQLGDGSGIAAVTGLPVVSDLRAMDIAFGGQGAPIVPIGEKLLLHEYDMFLNLGGIANISCNLPGKYIAFDVCPANRVLNMLVAPTGKTYDEGGQLAATGKIHHPLLEKLNELDYYRQPFPKSLANDFGTATVFPLIQQYQLPVADALRTYVEHIALQIKNSIESAAGTFSAAKLLATGGGAFNTFMMQKIAAHLQPAGIDVVMPDKELVNYKEALVMALIGVLRWREEYNVLASVTGAARNSINGALWLGNEA